MRRTEKDMYEFKETGRNITTDLTLVLVLIHII